MKYAESVSGEFVSGQAEKVLISLICAYVIFTLMTYLKLKPLLESIFPFKAPFKNIAVLGGFLIVFWVVLAYRMCGRGYGIATAVFAVSFCLFVSPWYGVITPYWFSVVGFVSFLILGILVEYTNGGFANLACIAVDWAAVELLGIVRLSIEGVIILGVIAFISGYAGDFAARKVVEILGQLKL